MKIPNKDEIKSVLIWGSVYSALHIPLGTLVIAKYTFRILAMAFDHLQNLYMQSFIQPMRALIINDQIAFNPVEEPKLIQEAIELFRWEDLKENPDHYPHIRVIAKSGMGKSTLARYLLHLLGGNQSVITPKCKPNDWRGVEVIGKGFDYDAIEAALIQIKDLMYSNYELINQSLTPEMINICLDEWRLIKENVPIAKEIIKELITVARDAKIRLICLAQGEQVSTWGLEGESDLGECFTDVRIGEFAIDHAKRLKCSKPIIEFLEKQSRPCMIGRLPALIPDLNSFQFVASEAALKLIETSETTDLQELNEQNEVFGNQEILEKMYRLARTNGISDSDFIKNIFGTSRYQEGKKFLEGLK